MNEWNIQSRAHACAACGQPFADRQVYRTLLFDEPPELRRSDICETCSQKQSAGDTRSRAGFISHWQGIYEAPTPPADPIHKDTAETLLRKLIEQNDGGGARGGGAGFFWRGGGFGGPPPPPADPIHKDTAETLLRKLIEQND